MRIARSACIAALLACVLAIDGASAQQGADSKLKEVQLGKTAFTVGDPIPSWFDQLPIPETTSTQPVVIRLADSQYFLGQSVPDVYLRRATLINDPASLTAAGRISISFSPDYERVKLHTIVIHRGQEKFDRTSTSNVRFLQHEQDLERGVYSGRVTASILVDDLRVGDTLEVAYSMSGRNPVFGTKAFGASRWETGLPTARRRVVLSYPINRQIAWRVVGDRDLPPLTPEDTVTNGIRRITFSEQPVRGFAAEAMTAPDFFGIRLVQFSEFTDWNDVVGWASPLFEAAAPQGDEFRSVVDRIRALPSEQARVVAALEFAQSQIRYFSVSLGENSHRPAPPDEVLRRRYGDCKDKSLLLIALLRELGIESKPVLLQIGRRAGLDKTLPSPQFFDHAIVQAMVGGRPYFLDPAQLGQHGRLDTMGQTHEGAQILVVARDTTGLMQLPAGTTDIIADEATERATLARFGEEGQIEVRRVWHGVGAERLRILYERGSREQFLKTISDALERRYPGARLAGAPAIRDDRTNNEFSIAASYRIPKLATEVDGNWVVAYSPDSLQNVIIASSSANRSTPLRIPGFPFHGKYDFEMTFPEQVSGSVDPRSRTVANKYFEATVTEYFRGNVARKTVELKTLRTAVEASDYPAYAEDLRSLNKAIGGAFAINKALFDSAAAGSAKADLPRRLQDQLLEVIKKTTETIDGGKLAGADLANVYCLRGNAQANLGRQEEALQDVNSAVRIAQNATSLSCRGETYRRFGQFEKGITDLTNAIALGAATDGLVFRGRGIAKYYAGRLEEANEDFARSGELSDKETRIYADMWFVTTSGLLRKPIPQALAARAAAEAGGDWPRAGLAMLAGKLSPDDMLKSLEKKQGDERQLALAEAYFYLGQYYLVAGDRKKAQENFEKTRSMGIINFIEHGCAELELERLRKSSTATGVTPGAATAAKPDAAVPSKPSTAMSAEPPATQRPVAQ
jgi:lipoprotein NlpI/transglutaminase-like putative cysteine protease